MDWVDQNRFVPGAHGIGDVLPRYRFQIVPVPFQPIGPQCRILAEVLAGDAHQLRQRVLRVNGAGILQVVD